MDVMTLVQANAGAIGTGAEALSWEFIMGQTKHRSTIRLIVKVVNSASGAILAKMDAQDTAASPTTIADDPMQPPAGA